MKIRLIVLMLALLAIVGCQVQAPAQNTTGLPVDNTTVSAPAINSTNTTEANVTEVDISDEDVVLEYTEGDLIQLKPEAVDPDQDQVIYYFSSPFTDNGKWQTNEGDSGKYLVTITATDGKANTSQDIIILINKAKKAPVIECPPDISVKEGEVISLNCNIYDPEDGDEVLVEYSGFMKSPSYTTTFDDAGRYTTVVKAKNKYKEAAQTINVTVLDTNRLPTVTEVPQSLTVMETDVVTLAPLVSDPDNDAVKLEYSEPFDSQGVWRTDIGDSGTYPASIIATDAKGGITKTDFSVEVTMKNTPPVLEKIGNVTVFEGETIRLPIEATDREDDELDIQVSGWMNSETYTTTFEDAGTYTVTVTVSDGEFDSSQTFNVNVVEKNRAPVFRIPA